MQCVLKGWKLGGSAHRGIWEDPCGHLSCQAGPVSGMWVRRIRPASAMSQQALCALYDLATYHAVAIHAVWRSRGAGTGRGGCNCCAGVSWEALSLALAAQAHRLGVRAGTAAVAGRAAEGLLAGAGQAGQASKAWHQRWPHSSHSAHAVGGSMAQQACQHAHRAFWQYIVRSMTRRSASSRAKQLSPPASFLPPAPVP